MEVAIAVDTSNTDRNLSYLVPWPSALIGGCGSWRGGGGGGEGGGERESCRISADGLGTRQGCLLPHLQTQNAFMCCIQVLVADNVH